MLRGRGRSYISGGTNQSPVALALSEAKDPGRTVCGGTGVNLGGSSNDDREAAHNRHETSSSTDRMSSSLVQVRGKDDHGGLVTTKQGVD